jgi:hypothetical protein
MKIHKELNPDLKKAVDEFYITDDIRLSEGYRYTVAFLKLQIHSLEMAVLNFDLNKPFANLALEKAKVDGAKLLLTKLLTEVDRVAASNARG